MPSSIGLKNTPTTVDRYALIREKMPREFILLQGTGCRWRRCTFCDYHTDCSEDPYAVNRAVLEQVTGQYGVLDVINSGSAMELDEQTLHHLERVVRERGIHTLWFEAHWLYRHRLEAFAARFAPAEVKFRCGVESFDPVLRSRWQKGIPPEVTPQEVAHYFRGVCLLCCTQGDSRERIQTDIDLARRYFDYFSVNLFCNNRTSEQRDEELAAWFEQTLYPTLQSDPKVEVLLNNTDLGVGD